MKPARFTSHLLRTLSLVMLLALLLALSPPRAQAAPDATITVNSTADVDDANPGDGVCDDGSGNCTLRAAISEANALAGADTITLPAGTYTLALSGHSEDNNATGDLDLTSDITINGAGAENTVIDANQLDRVLQVFSGATVALNSLTLTNGLAPDDAGVHCLGGGVYNKGTLTLSDSVVSDNATQSNSGFGGCDGGGVYNKGALTIERSAIRDNTAGNAVASGYDGGHGGGVVNYQGTLTVRDSVISGNSTGNGAGSGWDGWGGGVYANGGTATIENSTISGNAARGYGGGVENNNTSAAVTLIHCTITDNTADADNDVTSARGGGLEWSSGSGAGFIVKNTIIAGNTDRGYSSRNDCFGDSAYYTSQGYNLVGSGTGCPSGGTGDQTTSDAKLGPLQDNGGPTETHALQYDSPAVDAIPNATNGCGTDYNSDQRGETRPRGGLCDVGAYESPYVFWDGGGTGNNTSTAANWRGDSLPAETDIPVFYNTNTYVTVDTDLTVAGWVIDTSPTYEINLSSSLQLTVNGDWRQLRGYCNGDYNTVIDIAGAFDLSGGQFVAPTNDGLLSIGGGLHHTGGSFNISGGRVVLDNTEDQTLELTSASADPFNDLIINDGLLGYWKLDEGSGTTTADASGYGHAGTLHGAPPWSTYTPNTIDFHDPYALHFDRSPADYVDIPNTTAIDDLQELTLSTWVRLDSMPADANMRFVTLRNGKAVLRYKNVGGVGKLQFYMDIGGLQNFEVNHTWATGTWHHIAGTYDGNTMRLYLDGTEQAGAVSASGTVGTGDGVYLGWSGSDGALDGYLDDVRVYNRALSATEISDLADGKHPQTSVAATSLGAALDVAGALTLNSGTLAQPQVEGYWKLDEGSGTTAVDSSANGYDGTLTNSPTWSPNTPSVHFSDSNSLNFDRADADYVNMPSTANIDNLGQLSLSTWVNLASTPGGSGYTYMRFITLGNKKAVLRYVDNNGTGQLQFYMTIGGSTHSIAVNQAWNTGAWYHVTGTYDGSKMRLYLNGALQGSPLAVSGTVGTGNGVRLSHSSSSEALDGLLDDVRVYNRALSAAEVQALADGYDVRGQDITIGGDFIRNGGVFEHGGGSVTIDGSSAQTLDTDAIAFYDLTVNSGATLDLQDKTAPTVEGTLTNNGTLQQQRNVQNGTTQFLRILNQAGAATRYYGLDVYMPASSTDDYLGWTTVAISGNQDCTTDTSSPPVRRCFDIAPTANYPADLTFWYLESERNGNTAGSVNVYHWDGSAWQQETGTYTRSDDGVNYSVKVTSVKDFSSFVLRSPSQPEAVADLSASDVSGSLRLDWSAVTQDIGGYGLGSVTYDVYRAADAPYFTPGTAYATGVTDTWWVDPDTSVIGDPDHSYYYLVRVVSNDLTSDDSNRVGTFAFGLVPGSSE